MSVASNLTTLINDITDAYTSVANKGGTIPANKNTNNLPAAIDSIPTEGVELYTVTIIDYDGTVLKEVTDLPNGSVVTLPTPPTHSGLTFNKWVGSNTITNNTVTIDENDVLMGAIYTIDSGLSEFDITLETDTAEGRTITLAVDSGSTVNWGDGTADTNSTHMYAAIGSYTIKTNSASIGSWFWGQGTTTYNFKLTEARINAATINANAFAYCKRLKSVVLSPNVTSIGYSSFNACTQLQAFICAGATYVLVSNTSSALTACNKLFYFIMGDVSFTTLGSLGGNICQNCWSLISFYVPYITAALSTNHFNGCHKLKRPIFHKNSTFTMVNSMFNSCAVLNRLILPNVTLGMSLSSWTNNTSALKKLFFIGNMSIPLNATSSLSDTNKKLTKIESKGGFTISSNSVFTSAFSGSYVLTKIPTYTFSGSTIPNNTFTNAYVAEWGEDGTVTIPNTITTIGNSVFSSAFKLKKVIVPSSVTSIGNNFLQSCYGLEEVIFEESVSTVTLGTYTFSQCINLTKVTLPTMITTITSSMFSGCCSLKTITLPATVTSIATSAFANCVSLESVTILATTPPTLDNISAFNYTTCIIYVPAASVSAYQTATNWATYADRIKAIPA